MGYFVYLLECSDKTIYTGITTDVSRRVNEHKDGIGSRYTRAHGAKKIIYTEAYPTRSAALKREAEIKRWPRKKKIALAAPNAMRPALPCPDVRAGSARGAARDARP